jgi:hypothetical protein
MAINYDPVTHRAILTFPTLPGRRLADGDYRLTLPAGSVADEEGAPLASSFVIDFHALAGDVNGDRSTNDADLYRVWQNLLKPAGSRDLNSDLNGDGQVTIADVAVVRSHYLAALPPLSGPLGDVNNDGITNDLDLFMVWQSLLKPASQRNPRYDLNDDSQVTAADFAIVKISYLNNLTQAGGAGGTASPVPASDLPSEHSTPMLGDPLGAAAPAPGQPLLPLAAPEPLSVRANDWLRPQADSAGVPVFDSRSRSLRQTRCGLFDDPLSLRNVGFAPAGGVLEGFANLRWPDGQDGENSGSKSDFEALTRGKTSRLLKPVRSGPERK